MGPLSQALRQAAEQRTREVFGRAAETVRAGGDAAARGVGAVGGAVGAGLDAGVAVRDAARRLNDALVRRVEGVTERTTTLTRSFRERATASVAFLSVVGRVSLEGSARWMRDHAHRVQDAAGRGVRAIGDIAGTAGFAVLGAIVLGAQSIGRAVERGRQSAEAQWADRFQRAVSRTSAASKRAMETAGTVAGAVGDGALFAADVALGASMLASRAVGSRLRAGVDVGQAMRAAFVARVDAVREQVGRWRSGLADRVSESWRRAGEVARRGRQNLGKWLAGAAHSIGDGVSTAATAGRAERERVLSMFARRPAVGVETPGESSDVEGMPVDSTMCRVRAKTAMARQRGESVASRGASPTAPTDQV